MEDTFEFPASMLVVSTGPDDSAEEARGRLIDDLDDFPGSVYLNDSAPDPEGFRFAARIVVDADDLDQARNKALDGLDQVGAQVDLLED